MAGAEVLVPERERADGAQFAAAARDCEE